MSQSERSVAALPRSEILLYWLLSFGAHFYSFYQLHSFSKEHEVGLQREFLLEEGLLEGHPRDSSDFEWSFWTEWAKRSLLGSLIGHAVISRLTSICYPKLRVPALTLYGLVAAWGVLGVRGVGVLLLHLGLSFSVARLRMLKLTWGCNLLLLSTLYIQPIQNVQRGWYESEEEYYLLLFSVAVTGLRLVSFGLEHCWSPLDGGAAQQLYWLCSYNFYHPFFYNGPVISFKDYTQQMQRLSGVTGGTAWTARHLLLQSGRIVVWWCIAETMIHVMFMHAIQSNESFLLILPPWALGGLALALVQFFYVKYLVLFGLPSMLATLDNLVPPKLPRCVSVMHSFTGMWRHFDEGLYRWLIRYIYVPVGGSRRGPLYKAFSTALAFGFVCLWHGGHDYLQGWAAINWAGVLLEHALHAFFTSASVHAAIERRFSAVMKRRGVALLCAASTSVLILSNLLFLGGAHVGSVFWRRVFLQASGIQPSDKGRHPATH